MALSSINHDITPHIGERYDTDKKKLHYFPSIFFSSLYDYLFLLVFLFTPFAVAPRAHLHTISSDSENQSARNFQFSTLHLPFIGFFTSCCLMHIWASTIFYGSRDASNLVVFRDIHYYSVILILVERLGSLINPQWSLPSCCTLTNPKTPFEIGLEMKIGAEMDQNRPTVRTATV